MGLVFAAATGTSDGAAAAVIDGHTATGIDTDGDGTGAARVGSKEGLKEIPFNDGDVVIDIPPSTGTIGTPADPAAFADTRTWAALGDVNAAQRIIAMIGWNFMD